MAEFLIDENLSPKLAIWLRNLGYRAKSVRELDMRGASDEKLIAWIQKNNAVLITCDLDFGEWFYGMSMGRFGVITLRSHSQGLDSFKRLLNILHKEGVLKREDILNSLVTAEEGGYRLKKFDK